VLVPGTRKPVRRARIVSNFRRQQHLLNAGSSSKKGKELGDLSGRIGPPTHELSAYRKQGPSASSAEDAPIMVLSNRGTKVRALKSTSIPAFCLLGRSSALQYPSSLVVQRSLVETTRSR
jgi:hypothetical protein